MQTPSYHHQRFPENCQLEFERCRNFHALVLREIGYVPRGTNPGRFLLTNHPSHTPPQRFIDLYADALLNAAGIIVP